MQDKTSDNRRAFRRFFLHQLIELEAGGGEGFVHATGVNISLGGMLCEADESVDPYSSVYILVTLTQKDGSTYELKTEGIVIRCVSLDDGGYQLGIQFSEATSTDLEKIEAYIINAGENDVEIAPN